MLNGDIRGDRLRRTRLSRPPHPDRLARPRANILSHLVDERDVFVRIRCIILVRPDGDLVARRKPRQKLVPHTLEGGDRVRVREVQRVWRPGDHEFRLPLAEGERVTRVVDLWDDADTVGSAGR